jgi:very-short-patch-repair endonuclease
MLRAVDSPIESAFVVAFFDYMFWTYESPPKFTKESIYPPTSFGVPVEYTELKPKLSAVWSGNNRDMNRRFRCVLACGCQSPHIDRKRIDFVVQFTDESTTSTVCVELDGRMTHSSDEQKQRDRVKDRKMLTVGAPVIRFSGTEINADVENCVTDVVNILKWRTHRLDSLSAKCFDWSAASIMGEHYDQHKADLAWDTWVFKDVYEQD